MKNVRISLKLSNDASTSQLFWAAISLGILSVGLLYIAEISFALTVFSEAFGAGGLFGIVVLALGALSIYLFITSIWAYTRLVKKLIGISKFLLIIIGLIAYGIPFYYLADSFSGRSLSTSVHQQINSVSLRITSVSGKIDYSPACKTLFKDGTDEYRLCVHGDYFNSEVENIVIASKVGLSADDTHIISAPNFTPGRFTLQPDLNDGTYTFHLPPDNYNIGVRFVILNKAFYSEAKEISLKAGQRKTGVNFTVTLNNPSLPDNME